MDGKDVEGNGKPEGMGLVGRCGRAGPKGASRDPEE